MESWTDAAVKFFLRCLRVYRNPVHVGVPETRYIGVYQEPVHTSVPPYIFFPSPCITNTCAVPPIKNRKCAGAKFLAEIGRWRDRRRRPAWQRSAGNGRPVRLKQPLRKSKPSTMGKNQPAPTVDALKSAGCVVSPPNPAQLCYLLT
jgi:hypothetical protein